MLINLKSLSPLLLMISSICNRFYTIGANNGKNVFLGGYPSLTPLFEENPGNQGHKILPL